MYNYVKCVHEYGYIRICMNMYTYKRSADVCMCMYIDVCVWVGVYYEYDSVKR